MSDASAESSAAATDTIQVHDIADRAIVAAIAPAGVVIDDQLTILEFRGRVSSFFEPSPGVANLDLLHMAREELRLELQRAIDDARSAGEPVRRAGVVAFHDDAGRTFDLRVIPFFVSPRNGRFFAVLFEDSASAAIGRDATMSPLSQAAIEGELRRELASMRKYLRSVIERHEANNEELRILSEQLIASNEELHSINEELRTAKEDLEASNEELRTTNDEMIVRNAASMCLADDLANVLDSVAIAIVILGRDLRIRRFTPTAARLLGLVEADIGRPIGLSRTSTGAGTASRSAPTSPLTVASTGLSSACSMTRRCASNRSEEFSSIKRNSRTWRSMPRSPRSESAAALPSISTTGSVRRWRLRG
jgi:two-component system CheB/CheR fusion protein